MVSQVNVIYLNIGRIIYLTNDKQLTIKEDLNEICISR